MIKTNQVYLDRYGKKHVVSLSITDGSDGSKDWVCGPLTQPYDRPDVLEREMNKHGYRLYEKQTCLECQKQFDPIWLTLSGKWSRICEPCACH